METGNKGTITSPTHSMPSIVKIQCLTFPRSYFTQVFAGQPGFDIATFLVCQQSLGRCQTANKEQLEKQKDNYRNKGTTTET